MTKLNLKNAHIKAISSEDGLFAIVLTCRLCDVDGEVLEHFGLTAEIKSKER